MSVRAARFRAAWTLRSHSRSPSRLVSSGTDEVVTKYIIQDASGARVQVLQPQQQVDKSANSVHTFRLEGDKLIQNGEGAEGVQQVSQCFIIEIPDPKRCTRRQAREHLSI